MSSRSCIFSFSILWFGISCHSSSAEREGEGERLRLTEVQQQGIDLAVAPLQQDSIWEEVRLVGRTVVLAHAQGRVHSRVEGTVEGIRVREGQYVQAGEELFQVYSGTVVTLQREYMDAYQRSKAAQSKLIQQESLASSRLASSTEVAQVRAERLQAEAQLRAILSQLQLIGITPDTSGNIRLVSVRAPLSGYVTRVGVAIGEYIRPERELARIVNPTDLHADLYLSEREAGWIRPRMKVKLRFPALPELGEFFSQVEYVAQVEDSMGVHLVAHVRLPTLSYPVFSGIPIEGRLSHYKGQFYRVPLTALAYRGRQTYLFVQERTGEYVPLPVRATLMDTVALVEGHNLRVGMPVVVRGSAFLASQLWQIGQE
ncbi:MAG: efflux RND transporter periplasmic adaptor subunit [Bacteroidia bacterium]|nr:efflux RND transporter periplasmic adaptor subunit [Bacteroidia bacterium]